VSGDLVIRLDDVRDLSPRLEAVWRVLESHGAAVHLGAIPVDVTPEAAVRLRERAQRSPARVSVQQHGYRHVNHGTDKRKFEFGDERSAADQRHDLLAGRALLEERFGAMFDTVFVPPFDRCGQFGLDVLADSGFAGISVIETSSTPRDPRVPFVLMTTDPVQWKPVTLHRPWDGTLTEVRERLARDGYAGIELHHEIMDDEAVAGLDGLLAGLRGVAFPTMLEVARRGT
jgi:hypothetical protein